MLQGKIVKLRYYEPEDLEFVTKLRGSSESYDYFYEYEPLNTYMSRDWWENSFKKSNEKNFIIADKDNNAIGICALTEIDMRNKKAYFSRYYVSSKVNILGSAVEAELLCLEYAFNHLNLNKIMCDVFDENKSVISLHKHFGFFEEGYYKNHIFKNGIYKNIQIFSLFREDFYSKRNKIQKKIELLSGSNDES